MQLPFLLFFMKGGRVKFANRLLENATTVSEEEVTLHAYTEGIPGTNTNITNGNLYTNWLFKTALIFI